MDPSDAPRGSSAEVHGLQVELELDELVRAADLVAVGRVVSQTSADFEPGPEVLPGTYQVARFEASELLKGSPTAIEVAHSPTFDGELEVQDEGSHSHGPEVGEEYLLFLFRGDEVWGGRYLVLGDQGLGRVTAGQVELADGRTFALADVRALAVDG